MAVLVLRNPTSHRFTTEEVQGVVDERLRDVPHRLVDLPLTDAFAFVEREVREAIEQGTTCVVAVGGDGTVAMVAEAIARARGLEREVALGIVPAGTANVLAHELGVPNDLDGALALLEEGQALTLDAIEVEERHVLTQVGVGTDALMIRQTSRKGRMKTGRADYVRAFLRHAPKYRPRRYVLRVDGQAEVVWAWQIVVANVGVLATPPFTWGPGIDPTDGVLDLCVFSIGRPWDYALLFWNVVTGRHRQNELAQYRRVKQSLQIEGERAMLVQGDGDLIGRIPIEIKIAKGWIRVIVPKVPEQILPPADREAAATGVSPHQEVEATASASSEAGSVGLYVHQMIAQRSLTWALQGPLRHPIAGLSALDAALFLKINGLPLGGVLDRTLTWLSRLMHYGEGWVAVALAAIAIDRRSGLRTLAEAIPILWLTMLTVNFPVKSTFRRPRPFIAFVKARVVGHKPKDFSFPSGHSAAAFAGALLFATHFPSAAPIFYGLAAVVGFSRIYLGVHYPSDVVIGALVGTLLAAGYRFLLLAAIPWLRA